MIIQSRPIILFVLVILIISFLHNLHQSPSEYRKDILIGQCFAIFITWLDLLRKGSYQIVFFLWLANLESAEWCQMKMEAILPSSQSVLGKNTKARAWRHRTFLYLIKTVIVWTLIFNSCRTKPLRKSSLKMSQYIR